MSLWQLIAIGNKIGGANATAFTLYNDYRNYFVSENHIESNNREGIINNGDFGMILDNELSYNGDIGITLNPLSIGNLIMNNKLVCNIPQNITGIGTNDNLINNIEKSCEPC